MHNRQANGMQIGVTSQDVSYLTRLSFESQVQAVHASSKKKKKTFIVSHI